MSRSFKNIFEIGKYKFMVVISSRLSRRLFFFFFATPLSLQDLSSLTRDWTRATAVEVRSPNHWTTREAPLCFSFLHSCLPLKPQHLDHLLQMLHQWPSSIVIYLSFELHVAWRIFSPILFIWQLTKQLWHLFYCFLKLLFLYHIISVCVYLSYT